MKITLSHLLILTIMLVQGAFICAAQEKSPAFPNLQRDLTSTNGEVRLDLAGNLVQDHSKETFAALLKLLGDKSDDISYAAAESLEARKDSALADEFISAIKALPRDKRWPVYRAAKNYPTPRMVDFLGQCLEDEIRFQRQRTAFDNRNCFYLAQSLEQIARTLKKNVKNPPLENAS